MTRRAVPQLGSVLLVAALCLATIAAAVPPLHARGTALVDAAGHVVRLHGVNLGSWLLIEPWMAPVDRATVHDEFGLRQTLAGRFGQPTADRLVDAYEDAWITTDDLDRIRGLGLNAVRVPFWYRTVEAEDGTWRPDAFRRLDWVVAEAGRRGLYVVLDLHGVPGGQNKSDNSGRARERPTFWTDPADRRRTAEIWRRVAGRFRGNPAVAAYDLLNEPIAVPSRDALWAEYDQLYRVIRAADPDHTVSVEACAGSWTWDELPPPSRFGWRNVLYQTHSYEWAWNDLAKQEAAVARQVAMVHAHAGWDVPGYVGEFNPMARPAAWADARPVVRCGRPELDDVDVQVGPRHRHRQLGPVQRPARRPARARPGPRHGPANRRRVVAVDDGRGVRGQPDGDGGNDGDRTARHRLDLGGRGRPVSPARARGRRCRLPGRRRQAR